MRHWQSRRRFVASLLAGGLVVDSLPLWAANERRVPGRTWDQEEVAMGDEYWQSYLDSTGKDWGRHPNRSAEAALQAIAAPLFRAATRRNLEWRVGLLRVDPRDGRAVNAFAVGGGVILINDAILPFCRREGDLAAIIGHEIGHIDHRHCAERFFTEGLLARHGINPRIDTGKLAQALRNRMHEIVADEAIYRSYQRHQEYEADAAAVRALYATGYDPSQAADVFEELRKLHRGKVDVSLCIASTHPQFEDRIKRIQALALSHGRRPRKPDSAAFRRLMEAMA